MGAIILVSAFNYLYIFVGLKLGFKMTQNEPDNTDLLKYSAVYVICSIISQFFQIKLGTAGLESVYIFMLLMYKGSVNFISSAIITSIISVLQFVFILIVIYVLQSIVHII